MLTIISVYLVITFIAFEVYALLGVWTLFLNPKSSINRIFFAICLSLSIWSLGMCLSTSAPDINSALNWRRISAIGWSSLYSLLVHMALIMSGNKRLLKKYWIYPVLYLPALINLFAYTFHYETAKMEFNLVKTELGWVNIPVPGFWDSFFNFYYIGFSLVFIAILLNWGFRTNKSNRKQAGIIISGFFAALFLGSATDIIANRFIQLKIPSVASIVASIPLMAILISIKRYGFMTAPQKSVTVETGEILSEAEQNKIYRYMGIIIFAGNLLNFGHYYFFTVDLLSVLYFSVGLFITGSILFILPDISISARLKEIVMIVSLGITFPLLMIRFTEVYGSNIVWPIPLIFMCIATIFKNRYLLLTIITIAVLTQLWAWVKIPRLDITITGVDHFLRLALYGMGLMIALYVRRMYARRLNENKEQIQYQKMISQISTSLVTITETNLAKKIHGVLRELGTFFDADRVSLFSMSEDLKEMSGTNEWSRLGIGPGFVQKGNFESTDFPWWVKQIKNNQGVYIPIVEDLPAEAKNEKELILGKNIQSLVSISINYEGSMLGFLNLDFVRKPKMWSEKHQTMLKLPAHLVAEALLKIVNEKKINSMAYYDLLTGLPNRALFNDRLDKALALANRSYKSVAVMLLDLDSFKNVNDTMGHEVGDQLLYLVAQKLIDCVREYDSVSRFGGDEFLFILSQLNHPDEAEIVANKLMKVLEKPIVIDSQEFVITASIGIAVSPHDGSNVDTLVKNADMAMYVSKDRGKNQFTFCSQGMKEEIRENMVLTNDLKRAIERNELSLHYQPQVDSSTNEIIGLEALIRWEHPERGMIGPSIFIPLAEQTGLISDIGVWVLNTACGQNKEWQDQGRKPVCISVNLSGNQFHSSGLVKSITDALDRSGLAPEYLELEITESIAMKESGIFDILEEMKALGVALSIDDFGMEYSSLSRIKQMPIDRIKIDRQFVKGISINSNDEAIIGFIMDLSRNLGVKVIAEGVENSTQLSFLTKNKCNEIQGFYFYKPMPRLEIEKILT